MLQPGTTIGRYVVKRRLAEGGMAEIYLGVKVGPEGFNKEVVIKQIRTFLSKDPGFVQMFIAEARVASKLNHGNIVQIFDFARHEDTYFIAMEYVRGASLWELSRRARELHRVFPPVLVSEIGANVARGLHYAHALVDRGQPLLVVHRDVTPHNILISRDGAVKLTDFGIAKASTSATAPGALKGKFAYMSPEQARGEAVDARTDIFALGIILWELLTGGRLFEGESDIAVLRAVQERHIAPPLRLNPDVPPELDAIVMKALARNVADRFQSAWELERALANFVLKHARSAEDTNLAAWLSGVIPDEPDSATDIPIPELSMSGASAPGPDAPHLFAATVASPGRGVEQTVRSPSPDAAAASPPPAPEAPAATGVPATLVTPAPPPADTIVSQPALATPATVIRPSHPESPTRWPRRPALVLGGVVALSALVAFVASSTRAPDDPRRAGPLELALPSANLPPPPSEPTAPRPPPASAVALPDNPVTPPAPQDNRPAPDAPEVPAAVAQAVPSPSAAAPAEPQPRPPADTARPAPRASAPRGAVLVDAIPYGVVKISGRSVGEVTGQKAFKLAPGNYVVEAQHTRRTQQFPITVRPNETVTVKFRPTEPAP